MPPHQLHTSMEDLTAFSLGRLQGPRATIVESHVSQCDQCCQTLIDLTSTADTFVHLLQDTERHPDDPAQTLDDRTNGDENSEPALPAALADHPRYKVVELIGVGGMGSVYRAEHRVMERTVALKIINRQMVNNTQAIARFHREVKAAAKLSHTNIVAAHDAERAGDSHFLVMEYVEGIDLAQVVNTRGALPIGEACDYICQVAAGLQHAHGQGMVHRDIKPHNLMRTADGTVKILDFGLASLANAPIDRTDAIPARSDLTADGAIMGTPDYISPEQATDARSVDGRSDIYSLGATFYFLLVGRPPFDVGSVTEKLASHAELEAEPIDRLRDDIPTEVANVIARMMAKDPAARFQTPAELADALQPFVEQHRTNGPAKTHQPSDRRAGLWLAAAALLLATTAVGAAMFNRGKFTVAPSSEEEVAEHRPTPAPTPPPPTGTKTLQSMKFVLIPAAEFTMGTPAMRKANPAERGHQVIITTPFHMGIYEVRQQEYAWVMEDHPSGFCETGSQAESVAGQETGHFPVEGVSWDDATEFCRRLTALPEAVRAGHLYRLPTEAEWELACRAGTTTTFHSGDGLNGTHANVDGTHPWGMNAPGPSLEQTTVTGSYAPNAWGLFDMHGNVWEWCSDWYSPEPHTDTPQTDPTGPPSGSSRVVRGGSWDFGAMYARSAARDQRDPNYQNHNLGFRVVRVDQHREADSPQGQAATQDAP